MLCVSSGACRDNRPASGSCNAKTFRNRFQFLTPSRFTHFQAQNLSGLTFNKHLEGSAAYFAISRKPLAGGARVDHQVKALATIRALYSFTGFHVQSRRR
jgi:hypothetical protein